MSLMNIIIYDGLLLIGINLKIKFVSTYSYPMILNELTTTKLWNRKK